MELSTTVKTILEARDFKSRIEILIELSGYDDNFLAEKTGMNPNLFYAKKGSGNWTEEELEKLLDWVGNEELEDYLLGKMMDEAQKENDAEYLTSEEFKREMGWDDNK